VLDWHDGKSSEAIVWGYRWSGTATGLEMLKAIDAADSRLVIRPHPSFQTSGFYGIFAIGYDLDGDGGTFNTGTPGTGSTAETGSASDPDDHYREGWSKNGFWRYFNGATNPYSGGSWSSAGEGSGTHELANGSWDGWSFSTDLVNYSAPDPGFPTAAVPEPSTTLFLYFSTGVWTLARTRRRSVHS
jgi:hypothetical protein